MLKTMMRRIGLATATCAVIAPVGLLPSSPAFAEGGGVSGHSSQNADGGVNISVSVSYNSAASGSKGAGGTVTSNRQVSARVQPVCRYQKGESGAEAAASMKAPKRDRFMDSFDSTHPNWRDHENDREGHWYYPLCVPPADMSTEEYGRLSEEFHAKNGFVYVPAGGQPPAPVIDGGTLAKAAWKAVEIPPPSVEMNPQMGDDVQTLVGVENWVWASAQTPQSVTATATAGPVTATVTATSSGLTLSAPDSKVSCRGFGTPWRPGMPEGSSSCTITFTRSSAHLGGSTSMRVGVSYSASYTATDGARGGLPSVSTSGSLSLRVGEAQSLNTGPRN